MGNQQRNINPQTSRENAHLKRSGLAVPSKLCNTLIIMQKYLYIYIYHSNVNVFVYSYNTYMYIQIIVTYIPICAYNAKIVSTNRYVPTLFLGIRIAGWHLSTQVRDHKGETRRDLRAFPGETSTKGITR